MKLKILVLSLLSLTAHAEEKPVPTVICTTYGTGEFFGGAKFEFFGAYEGATVKFSGIDENGHFHKSIEVPSNMRMGSWVTYRASFELNGHKLDMEFSNYQSPNVGTMRIDGKLPAAPIACMLPGGSSE